MTRFSNKSNTNIMILVGILIVIAVIGAYCVYSNKTPEKYGKQPSKKRNEEVTNTSDAVEIIPNSDDTQIIEPSDNHEDETEFL